MPVFGHKGQLLVKVQGVSHDHLFTSKIGPQFPGYTVEPISVAVYTASNLAVTTPMDHWLLAKPSATVPEPSPWDAAHKLAGANNYDHYVEPDIIHDRETAFGADPEHKVETPDEGLNKDWPPSAANHVSPAWHLDNGYSNFFEAWKTTKGAGCRIAHLDTGYTPGHISTPRNLLPKFGYDYWDDKPDAIDPGTKFGVLTQPGHGTATIALLAGNAVDLTFGSKHYKGDFGGAPDAEVVPVRISPSVVHIATSTMAKGLYHALAPLGDATHRCDVVSISHGGLPSSSWADAVNTLYDHGIVVVAASGDSYYLIVADLATRFTVYPSAFNRVLTAVGVTYAKEPYITQKVGVMQGCWGPNDVMEKAVAGYTPNVAWMRYDDLPAGFDMDGGGTSASTPQVAAACALWIAENKRHLPADGYRVEACRRALFIGVNNAAENLPKLGRGLLNAGAMMVPDVAKKAIAIASKGPLSPADQVSFPLWRLLMGIAPPDSAAERMYETEVAQLVLTSKNKDLLQLAAKATESLPLQPNELQAALDYLKQEPVSAALRSKLDIVQLP